MADSFKLTPGEWSTLRRLLDQALDRPAAERAGWLATLGPEDAPFRPRLQALLAHADDAPARDTVARLLETFPQVDTAAFAPMPHDDALAAGGTVGPYRLLRPLGEGGMGEVWLAERTDVLQQRQVALKLPRVVTGRARLAERLAREREILATLEHPNIARLYDAGVGADGQPYLALEYVEGERIDAWCARRALDVPARLRLFLQVSRAVAHAHARLVVHRDLKPTNILVTGAGEVRLLDFGIAKLLEDGRARDTELTQLAGRALTPDYAAPEQIVGEPVGTAADIYALGVVLFELLCGRRPYRLKHDSRAALEAAIAQAEVPRPSSVVEEARLRHRLRGDLDTIVLKALKRSPAERYGTVEALADDIERHLARRPVRARPDSPWYRLRKFTARNKLAVGASGAVLLAILAGSVVAVWQARLAVAEKQRAEAVKDFVASLFREANPFALASGRPVTAAELLRGAQQRIARQLDADPSTQAELLTVLGASLAGLGDFQRASDVLAQATTAWQGVAPPDDPRALRAQLQLADAEHRIGRTAAARERLGTLEALFAASGRTDSEDYVHLKVLEANFEFNEGRFTNPRAFAAAQAAVSVAERALGPRHEHTIGAYNALGVAHRWRNELAQALSFAEKAYRSALAHFGEDGRHPRTIQLESEYGRALAAAGRLGEAVAHMAAAAQRATEAYGPNHVIVQHIKGTLATTQLDYGEIKEALANLADAAAQDVGAAELSLTYRASQATVQGRALLVARRAAAAVGHYEQALALFGKAGARGGLLLSAEAEHALALAQAGRVDEASGRLERMVDERRKSGQPGDLQAALRYLAHVRALQSRHDDALALLREGTQILEKITAGPTARASHKLALADAMSAMGLALVETGAAAEALRHLDDARERYAALQGRVTPGHADALVGSARARLLLGRATEAEALFARADAFWQAFDPDNRAAGEAAFWLARGHEALAREGEARRAYQRAAQRLAGSPLPGDALLAQRARSAAARARPP